MDKYESFSRGKYDNKSETNMIKILPWSACLQFIEQLLVHLEMIVPLQKRQKKYKEIEF